MNKVAIVTHESEVLGYGHYKRTQEIAKAFGLAGHNTEIVLFSKTEKLPFLKDRGILLVDVPFELQDRIATQIQNKDFFALDWISTVALPKLNFVAFLDSTRRFQSSVRTYSGSEFFVIPDFLPPAEPVIQHSDQVLVTIGSNPTSENLSKAIKFASRISEKMVVAGNTRPREYLTENYRIEFLGMVENLPSLLGAFDKSITNGGISMMQSLYIGLTTYSWPQNRQEKRFLDEYVRSKSPVIQLKEKGSSLEIEIEGAATTDDFRSHFDLVGAERIVNLLLSEASSS